MANGKYILFALGDQEYCVNLLGINGIEHDYNIIRLPINRDYIKGIINLRNEVIPIFDLKERFSITTQLEKGERQLLIAETHNLKIGFEVDNVIGIKVVNTNLDVKEIPGVVKARETTYLESVVQFDKKIVLCISIDNIMSQEEFDDINKLIEDNI